MNVDSEILNEFLAESNGLLLELGQIVEKLENSDPNNTFPENLMTEFAQKIDRIMGAAKTISMLEPDHLGFIAIGKVAELCKSIGYKAAEKKNSALLPIYAAFWADTIEVIENFLKCVQDKAETRKIAESFPPILQKRLAWLKTHTEK